ncbi:velvet factor-domain-containing protein [Dichotomocladium elegans]|nr:velvet factor-domain-containing protein [Dichotomocladium elegans]
MIPYHHRPSPHNQCSFHINPESHHEYPQDSGQLIIRQQPGRARLCSFKDKVDRRPIDPPPIVELSSHHPCMLHDPFIFLYATLVSFDGHHDLFLNSHAVQSIAGAAVQSPHQLKNVGNSRGAFFVFSDLSVRIEGHFRLKFTLYRILGYQVSQITSVLSDVFQVFSPKAFPGMSESTALTKWFSDQGVRVRIRRKTGNNNPKGRRRVFIIT